jgi:hypothetical protein
MQEACLTINGRGVRCPLFSPVKAQAATARAVEVPDHRRLNPAIRNLEIGDREATIPGDANLLPRRALISRELIRLVLIEKVVA